MPGAVTEPGSLMLFNSLTRALEPFTPVHPGEARVYTCGPTVYNYPHIGNMRAYVFADVLGRMLSFKGYALRHVINITDVGHLTDDADAGEDKLEQAAARNAQSIWDIARHHTQAFRDDVKALNIREPAAWSIATEYVPAMIEFAESIADRHCYELDGGLYFDVSTVADYGRLARTTTDEGEGRIDPVEGKRHAADFAIWRRTPPGETRQMEWDSPWGRGAPGWHLECSVMSGALLGFPFDIHTGGIDHREIHHPNEIAQNQAFCCTDGLDIAANSGANIWMHNNFLVAKDEGRTGKMSKSSGEFPAAPAADRPRLSPARLPPDVPSGALPIGAGVLVGRARGGADPLEAAGARGRAAGRSGAGRARQSHAHAPAGEIRSRDPR